MKWRTPSSGCLAGCLVLALPFLCLPAARADEPAPVKIGMAQTMVVDVPQPLVDFLGYPFSGLMKEFTGLNGKLLVGGSPFDVAKKLDDKELDIAIFQGLEYAWVQSKHANIKPFMVVLYQHPKLHVELLVHKDSGFNSFADLKGKDLAYPKKSKEHVRVFIERHCGDCGDCAPKAFFGNVSRPGSTETALDDLLEGKCQAVIGDKTDIEFYRFLKPGAFNQFKVVKSSEAFPAAVVAYREGAVDEKVLAQFRSGMIKANKSERGRDMMAVWRITSFEPVPADYQQTLDDILKCYPTPETKISTTGGGS
jgi:ABC-type phosphate/phosphonate transport system substrate-binding protein